MRYRKGFKKFSMSLESHEEPKSICKFNLLPEEQELPGSYDKAWLNLFINDVLEVGVGGQIDPEMVNLAFTWDTHCLEDSWARLYLNPIVSQKIYDVCKYWKETGCV